MKITLIVFFILAISCCLYLGNAENPVGYAKQDIKKQTSKTVLLKPSYKIVRDMNKQLESIENQIARIDEISTEMKKMVENLKSALAARKSYPENKMTAKLKQLQDLDTKIQMESRQYNSISNALKVMHDSEMAAIRNMK